MQVMATQSKLVCLKLVFVHFSSVIYGFTRLHMWFLKYSGKNIRSASGFFIAGNPFNISRHIAHLGWETPVFFTLFTLSTYGTVVSNCLKFEKRGDSREKGGGGNEIHAPSACDILVMVLLFSKLS
jgi:hypothetical protein